MGETTGPYPASEKPPFKPYANIRSAIEKALCEILAEAFSEMDPRQRPWCGVGLEPGLLAVSPTNLTMADLREMNGVQEGLVQVPLNWREPWHVKTNDGVKHQIQRNPCEQAERAISTIKHSLRSCSGGEPTFPSIKYLIAFPDRYEIHGPKEFSILDRHGVLTLNLTNLRSIAEEILQRPQQERLDSRRYRKWIEGSVLRKNDDSIVGTWLDPAFDTLEAEHSKRQRWPFRHIRHQNVSAEEKETSPSEALRTRVGSKVILIVITVILMGMIGWQLYAARTMSPVSDSSLSSSAPRPEKTTDAADVVQAAIPQDRVSLAENENRDIVPATEAEKSSPVKDPKPAAKNRLVESASKPRDQIQDAKDAELKRRQNMELQIQQAIRRRAITGVTVRFANDTAYLEGQVGTENQKSVAEKAARSVSGVKKVQSSIEVNLLPPVDR